VNGSKRKHAKTTTGSRLTRRIEAPSHTFEIPRFTPQRRVLLRVDWFIGLPVLFGIGQSYFFDVGLMGH